jgi:tetratricopeptide (TPR) repeat protein
LTCGGRDNQIEQYGSFSGWPDHAPELFFTAAALTMLFCAPASAANRSAFYNNRCSDFYDNSEYDRAIAACDEAIRLDPRNANPYVNRGFAWYTKGLPDRAIADFDEAIRLDPKFGTAYNGRGEAWREKRDFDHAMADYGEAIRLLPKADQAFPYNNRALLWRDKGDYDRAIADDNEAIRLDPKFSKAISNRGEIWRLKGDLDRALADQDYAIKLEPKSIINFLNRAETKRYKGEFARALADYDQSLRLLADYVPAFVGRGLTYEKMDDMARARIEFQKAVDSRSPEKSDISRSSLETARARLAALDSGAAQPAIPVSLPKASSSTSVPTPAAVIPVVAPRVKQGRRVALVIGNSAYQNVPALPNPQKDATAVAASLRNIGFEVVTSNDATREQMVNSLRNFANEAEKSDWAVVYYARHGMEVGGVNYLVPVDAKIAVDRDIQYEAVPLSQVLNSADTAKKIKLVMLHACRDNPFTPRKTAAPEVVAATISTVGAPISTRSSNGRGLAEVKVTGATLVVYAAKDGQVALDGEGGNSPFAVAVTQRLATPGVEINKIFRLVRDDVMEATAGRQEPYTYGSLPGKEDFFFVAR